MRRDNRAASSSTGRDRKMPRDMGRQGAVEWADTIMQGEWMARATGQQNVYAGARQRLQHGQKNNTLMATCG